MSGLDTFYNGKNVLVTGACGTVGKKLTRLLFENFETSEIVCADNNESELFFLEHEYLKNKRGRFFLADVRDRHKLNELMENIDIVFHTAAFKHVSLCERSPFEAVQTNIMGVNNIIASAVENKVGTVIFTSSDKAVNPTNVMGTSKLMGEKIMTAANNNLMDSHPILASTRFGNVLGSRGSVIAIFKEQIKNKGPVTLTDPEMTRFIMSLNQAVSLVIESAFLANGGEVFITKMPVIRIKDLAEVMIEELAPVCGFDPGDIKIEVIGNKPGEKMYEELMNSEETRRTMELERFYVVLPVFGSVYRGTDYTYMGSVTSGIDKPYNSEIIEPMTKDKLKVFLYKNNLLKYDNDH